MQKSFKIVLLSFCVFLGIFISNLVCKQVINIKNIKYNISINGVPQESFPTKGNYIVSATCSNSKATWDYDNWKLSISKNENINDKCNIEFTTIDDKTYINTYVQDLSDGTCSNTTYTTATSCESNGGMWSNASTDGYCTEDTDTTESECATNSGTWNSTNQYCTYSDQTTCESNNESWYNIVNENGYRYEGSNPYNYVLYNGELWRIIGVFETTLSDGSTKQNLTKIIRNESIGGYAFDNSNTNAWLNTSGTRSSLNILLNDYYYNKRDGTTSGSCYFCSTILTRNCDYSKMGLSENYRAMVENVTWYLGGYSSATNPNDMYGYERSTTKPSNNAATSTGYVGLMYPSDYGYSVLASSCARNTNLSSYSTAACAGKAWMLQNGYDWTIAPHSSGSDFVWFVNSSGYLDYYNALFGYASRPVLYLKSGVYIISGEGTISNPYILGM